MLHGIFIIDAVDFGGFNDGVAFEFHAPQGGGRVGGEIGVGGATPDDDHAARFQVLDSPRLGEVFADGLHADGGQHLGAHAVVLQRRLERQRIDDRGQHAHLVALDTVEAFLGPRHAAEDVAAADDDAYLHAACGRCLDLLRVGLQHLGRKPVFLLALQRFAAQFQKYALVFHLSVPFVGRRYEFLFDFCRVRGFSLAAVREAGT